MTPEGRNAELEAENQRQREQIVLLSKREGVSPENHLKIPRVATPESGQHKRAPNLGGGRAARDDRAC